MKFTKGDVVIMVNCGEADFHKGKEWTCRTDSFNPRRYPDEEMVYLEGYAGWFLCECLEKKN